MLPPGLDLLSQSITPQGTHPVVLQCHSFTDCQFSFPTMLPTMHFHEQTLGIPFVATGGSGPYYFMPKLYLDDLWNLFIGRNFWGFDKELARVHVTAASYDVASTSGRRLSSLAWGDADDEARPVIGGHEEFEPVRSMMSQTLLSFSPAGVGQVLSLTDFDRSWNLGTVSKLRAKLDIEAAYCPRFGGAHCDTADETGNESEWPPRAFELSAQWWLSYPYLAPGATSWIPAATRPTANGPGRVRRTDQHVLTSGTRRVR